MEKTIRIRISMESEETGRVVLSGAINGVGLWELRREIDRVRRMRKHIELDLEEVTLLDRPSAAFLAEQVREGIRLVNCPNYIEPWIEQELPR